MQIGIIRALPAPLAVTRNGARVVTRTGARAARVGAFAFEVWSRLLVDGLSMGPDERARELSWVAENMCALHGVRLSVRGPLPRSPSLLVANHVSYFDPLIIASLAPCTAIAKRQVAAWPCIGELSRRLGVLYVERECPANGARVLREAIRLLDAGVSVLVFPEGTTTRGDRVLPFKRGSFGAAAIAGVPIVPVALRYGCTHAPWVGNDTFLPHYMRAITKLYTRVSVEFLEPLAYAGARSVEELAGQAREAIARVLERERDEGAPVVPRLEDAWSVTAA